MSSEIKSIPIGDILFQLPTQPENIRIDGWSLQNKDQKWRRTLFPNNWDSLSETEQLSFVKEDIRRRTQGYWFMVNNTPTYITGDMYFFLNWFYISADTPDGYPEYRSADRLDFYFWEYCQKDPCCYGMLYMAGRRSGKTEKGMASLLNKTMLEKEKHSGLQAPSTKDAKENLFQDRIIRAWKKIPFQLRPLHDADAPKNTLKFSAPEKKGIRKKEKYAVSLGSWIDFEQTESGAYQGKKLFRYHLDEPGGLVNMDLIECWSTVKECFVQGSKIFGKAYLGTTIEEMKERAGKPYLTLWQQSNVATKDGNGQTASGLYRYQRPADLGLEGYIDEFGDDMIDFEGKRTNQNTFIDNKIAGAPTEQKIKVRRQYARNEDDAFGLMVSDWWDSDVKEILRQCEKELRGKEVLIKKIKLFEHSTGDIMFNAAKDNDEECIYIYEDPKEGVSYYASFDGTGSDKNTGSEKGSKVSVTITKGADGGSNISYTVVAYFEFRPKAMEDGYRVTFNICSHYNKFGKLKLGIERNAGQGAPLISFFINRGGRKMLLRTPKITGVIDNNFSGEQYGWYLNDSVRDVMKYLSNSFLRQFAHNIGIHALVVSLIQYGISNQDFSSSFIGSIYTLGDWNKLTKKPQVKSTTQWFLMPPTRGSDGLMKENWVERKIMI